MYYDVNAIIGAVKTSYTHSGISESSLVFDNTLPRAGHPN